MTTPLLAQLISRNFASVHLKDDSVNAKAVRLSETIESNLRHQISSKTLTRYYKQFVLETETKSKPDSENLEILCRNLGCKSINDFERKFKTEEKKKGLNFWRIAFFGSAVVAMLIIGVLSYLQSEKTECVTWDGNKYVAFNCEKNINVKTGLPVLRLNNENEELLNMTRLPPTSETKYFKNNTPVVWYGKSIKGDIQFFNQLGRHPETGKTLKEVTPYIVQKYVEKQAVVIP